MRMRKDAEGKIGDIGGILDRDQEIVCTEALGITVNTIAMRGTEKERGRGIEKGTEEEMYVYA